MKKEAKPKILDPKKDEYFNAEGRKSTKNTRCADIRIALNGIYRELYPRNKTECELQKCLSKVCSDDLIAKPKRFGEEAFLTPIKTCDEVLALYLVHISCLSLIHI